MVFYSKAGAASSRRQLSSLAVLYYRTLLLGQAMALSCFCWCLVCRPRPRLDTTCVWEQKAILAVHTTALCALCLAIIQTPFLPYSPSARHKPKLWGNLTQLPFLGHLGFNGLMDKSVAPKKICIYCASGIPSLICSPGSFFLYFCGVLLLF